jgi:hypothetical protein
VGEWLRANTPADASIGTLEVGIIGYYAGRRMIDFAGLIQPDIAARLRPESTYADTARWAVERFRPDYLVLPAGQFPGLEGGYAARNCRVEKSFPGSEYGYPDNLDIYNCLPGG